MSFETVKDEKGGYYYNPNIGMPDPKSSSNEKEYIKKVEEHLETCLNNARDGVNKENPPNSKALLSDINSKDSQNCVRELKNVAAPLWRQSEVLKSLSGVVKTAIREYPHAQGEIDEQLIDRKVHEFTTGHLFKDQNVSKWLEKDNNHIFLPFVWKHLGERFPHDADNLFRVVAPLIKNGNKQILPFLAFSDFFKGDFTSFDFSGADLQGVNLKRADLTDATITIEQLLSAASLYKTKLSGSESNQSTDLVKKLEQKILDDYGIALSLHDPKEKETIFRALSLIWAGGFSPLEWEKNSEKFDKLFEETTMKQKQEEQAKAQQEIDQKLANLSDHIKREIQSYPHGENKSDAELIAQKIKEFQGVDSISNWLQEKDNYIFLPFLWDVTDRREALREVIVYMFIRVSEWNLRISPFLPFADFEDAFLIKANLAEGDFQGASFKNAKLGGAIFQKANLQDTNFDGANLDNADLEETNAENSSFRNTILRDVNFERMNAKSADFSEGDNLNPDRLLNTQSLYQTKLPVGASNIIDGEKKKQALEQKILKDYCHELSKENATEKLAIIDAALTSVQSSGFSPVDWGREAEKFKGMFAEKMTQAKADQAQVEKTASTSTATPQPQGGSATTGASQPQKTSVVTGIPQSPNSVPNPQSETLQLELAPMLSPEVKELVGDLEKYISRIEEYKGNYAHGFWFFAAPTSRAINRQANYELAKWLRDELRGGAVIAQAFSDVEKQRTALIKAKGLDKLPGYVERGIHSRQLNDVIDKVRGYLEKAEKAVENGHQLAK